MKIVFLTDMTPLTERDVERFGFTLLAAKGAQVLHWNVSKIIHSDRHLVAVPNPVLGLTREMNSVRQLRRDLRKLGPKDVVVMHNLTGYVSGPTHLLVILLAARSKALFTSISINHIPIGEKNRGYIAKFVALFLDILSAPPKLISITFLLADRSGLLGALFRIIGLPRLDAVWAGVSLDYQVLKALLGPHTLVEYIHNFDYDRVLEIEQRPARPVTDRYFLLLGGLGGLHPDFLFSRGAKEILPPEEWQATMSNLLRFLEKRSGFRPVVAAHPRGTPEDLERLYSGLKVFQGQTPVLVRDAEFVVTYDGSTSVSFAVAMRKPLITVLTAGLASREEHENALVMGRLLGAPIFTGQQDFLLRFPIPIDEERYSRYISRYLKRETSLSRHFFWSQVLSSLSTNFGLSPP